MLIGVMLDHLQLSLIDVLQGRGEVHLEVVGLGRKGEKWTRRPRFFASCT